MKPVFDALAGHARTRPDATAFSDGQRHLTWAGLADAVPFLLSERLRALGAKVENGLPLLSHVREDRNLLTGQNPKSSARVAELLIERLAAG